MHRSSMQVDGPGGALGAEDDRSRRRQSRLDREQLRRRKRISSPAVGPRTTSVWRCWPPSSAATAGVSASPTTNRSSAPSSRPHRHRRTPRPATSGPARRPSPPPPARARTPRPTSPASGHAPHLMAGRDELGDQPPTDVARRTRDQDTLRKTAHSRPACRRREETNRSGSARVRVRPG